VSEQVGELAPRAWDQLVAHHRDRTGAMTVTELMLASDLGRAERGHGKFGDVR
jgi:hypothetical protein